MRPVPGLSVSVLRSVWLEEVLGPCEVSAFSRCKTSLLTTLFIAVEELYDILFGLFYNIEDLQPLHCLFAGPAGKAYNLRGSCYLKEPPYMATVTDLHCSCRAPRLFCDCFLHTLINLTSAWMFCLQSTYGLDLVLPGTSGFSRLVAWYAPGRKEGMLELRLF
jgi:hypothetical protein